MILLNTRRLTLFTLLCLAAMALNACGIVPQTQPAGNQTEVATAVTSPTDAPTLAPTDIPTQAPSPTPLPPFTVDELKNATYLLKDFASLNDGSDSMALVNGTFSKSEPAGTGVQNFNLMYVQSTTGDLNGDGLPDAAVILAADTGGSGTFVYLAAVINQAGKPLNVDAITLGDRTVIESMSIQDGKIAMQTIIHGPQDPLCCPTLKTSETYMLENNNLLTQAEKTAAPLAQGVIEALKAKDMGKLASFIHPAAGVRFSPYVNVKDTDLVFTPDQLAGAMQDSKNYVWGVFDGSGAPIELTFSDYYAKFVYSMDFASAAEVSYNHILSIGNMIDNSRDFYPNSIIVEYFLPGTDPQYGGMDWQSLRLVFQTIDNQWYLVGIIHSQWTI
jgi:hypothetical protein